MPDSDWSTEESRHVYGIGRGDLHFLDINERGELEINIGGHRASLRELIRDVRSDVKGSFTLRIPQLITSQIEKLIHTFDEVAKKFQFSGRYKPLYPIKVNQRKLEVSTIIHSSPFYGLEAGTKSEFIICTKVFREERNRIIMSNGVKDESYFMLMKKALDAGYRIYISIEDITELRNAIKFIPRDKLHLFFRIKPYISVHGKWGKSAGRDSKFGLDTSDLLESIELLRRSGLQNSLIGIHAHPGSQVTQLDDLQNYSEFLSKIYRHLKELGFDNLHIINFGGGLPINYSGRLPEDIFRQYFLRLFQGMTSVLGDDLPLPDVMTESGRAISALSAMVLIQILEVKHNRDKLFEPAPDHPRYQGLSAPEVLERWDKVRSQSLEFDNLDAFHEHESSILRERALLRKAFFDDSHYRDLMHEASDLTIPDIVALGNFSVFNSACDHVLVSQYFPVIPIEHLDNRPDTLVRLVDITCDSDGELSNFIPAPAPPDLRTRDGFPLTSEEPILLKGTPIPRVSMLWDSYLAIPLLGAYQDIVEFDHNLIGDLQDVLLVIDDRGLNLKPVGVAEPIENLLLQMGYRLKVEGNPYVVDESFE